MFGLLARELTPSDERVTLRLSNANGSLVEKDVPINPLVISGSMFGVLAASSSIRYSCSFLQVSAYTI